MPFQLSRAAEQDVIDIYIEGLRMFGPAQAERYHLELASVFETISQNPRIARERHEITPPVRVHPHKAHLIIYIVDGVDDVFIVRLRHGREDWVAGLEL